MRKAVMIAVVCLVGCAPQVKQLWMRTDGQRITGNAALEQQVQIDKTICDGEMQKANLSGTQFCRGAIECGLADAQRAGSLTTVAKGCMAQKGYVMVPETEAEQKLAEFSAAAKQQQKR
jgi:hypothetical protein